MKTSKLKQRGVVLVEMAIVLPIFILILVGTMEFGIVLHDYLILENASREGARLGAVGGSEDAVRSRVRGFFPQLQDDDIDVTNAQGKRGDSVIVTASYDVPLITSLMPSFTLNAKSEMRLE